MNLVMKHCPVYNPGATRPMERYIGKTNDIVQGLGYIELSGQSSFYTILLEGVGRPQVGLIGKCKGFRGHHPTPPLDLTPIPIAFHLSRRLGYYIASWW